MIDSPEVAGDYYQKIADRIAVSLNKHNALFFLCRPDYRTLVSVYESVSSSCLKLSTVLQTTTLVA
jgi:hypothetical protein